MGRDQARLELVAAELPGKVHAWPVDLSDRHKLHAAIADLPRRFPELSIVINNAGIQIEANFPDGSAWSRRADLRRETAVNLDAVVALCAGLLPHLAKQPRAAIGNVTSGLAIAPKRSSPVYCATKAGVRASRRAPTSTGSTPTLLPRRAS
ncbi:SDR family NAD(P)-dependent oxidoreductase [Sphingomonas sp. ABOLG]|jgi:uncharacterized oxidoreductase|uniref:SDR family NAD(P)-dependent oxidoreductase n=1 Tax=Sphingomonas sp. ABOLG TaxID=1985880 RepID=UPI000F7E961B|nr:SDR family NAD(P)-dependent oxidoreductase [Sphingomonas sp. ABOLG]RSV17332.1 SDR family NAD(P)-dependent oxidoreductase [Sphingomonas sp. ABOLG]